MAAVQKYTIADVASRNGKGNAPVWMIYKDSVYDVTSYIPQHPAGDVMLEEAGRDCTKAFDDSDHSSDARTILHYTTRLAKLLTKRNVLTRMAKRRRKWSLRPLKLAIGVV